MRFFIFFTIVLAFSLFLPSPMYANSHYETWQVRSIDTMKYSRDLARQALYDSSFQKIIDDQVSRIAATGATHVAVGTPYDDEFLPVLSMWVAAARKYNIHVWFRGNVSGWEGWFAYPKITPAEHTKKITDFILNHASLFADGDIFTSCPECENGGPGDPRKTGNITSYRQFLVGEYKATSRAFATIHKNVASNYYSMNGDIARLVMDQHTTSQLDGIVVIDHYVKTPAQLRADVLYLLAQSHGRIIIGEIGAPIPDLHGVFTEEQQAKWIDEAFKELSAIPEVIGINYWTNENSSTALWNTDGTERKAVSVITSFYSGEYTKATVIGQSGQQIKNAVIIVRGTKLVPDAKGLFYLPYMPSGTALSISAPGYKAKEVILTGNEEVLTIPLEQSGYSTERGFHFFISIRKLWNKFISLFK